jgi:hypothetical protein
VRIKAATWSQLEFSDEFKIRTRGLTNERSFLVEEVRVARAFMLDRDWNLVSPTDIHDSLLR